VARKSTNDAAKEKAAKQKKTVIVLGVVLAGAVAFAAHTMMGMSGGSPASAPQAADPNATTTATAAPTAPTGSALPAAPSLGSIAPATTTPAASSSPLVSAVQAPAGTGQLQSFSLFESKDPFHTSGPGAGGASSSPSSPAGGTSSGGGSAPKIPPAPPAPPAPAPTSAVISVNGSSESVVSGSNFPAASAVFQLLSLTATTAKISVVGGSYASGAGTLTLRVNKPVTLVNTADGTRYTLLLMPQGTQASVSGGAAAAPAPTTTTTPVTGG
jgi:hypothetical protein